MPTVMRKRVGIDVPGGKRLVVRPAENGCYQVLLDGVDVSEQVRALTIKIGFDRITTAQVEFCATVEDLDVVADVEEMRPVLDVSVMGRPAEERPA